MIISLVELTTDTGISDQDLFHGIPNADKVKRSKLYKELIEDCGGSKFILAQIKTFAVNSLRIKLLRQSGFTIIPDAIFTGKRSGENEVPKRNVL